MSTNRIILFGANGQVGQAFCAEQIPADWELRALSRAECDITDHRTVQHYIKEFHPDIVINTAGMTAVDRCETEHDEARHANFDAPANLAAQCAAIDAMLIHLSTDYVFDGNAGNHAYLPDDMMNPINVYGESKMMGEEAVRHSHPFSVILRISSVFSAFGTNLLTKMIQAIETKDELRIVTDQICAPTPAQDVARALVTISTQLLHGKSGGYGIFHLCGAPPVNRLEFAQAMMEAYAPHTTRRPIILPALSSDFPGFAPRPAHSVLNCDKIREIYGIQQRPWREGLDESIQVWLHKRKQVA